MPSTWGDPLRIGNVEIENRLILAPMAGITDRPFRSLCRRLGAGLAVSEMLSANPALRGSRKSRERADHRGEPGPIAVQIAGSDPAWMAEAARASVDQGAEIIDINLGCPAKKVCKVAAGSALLRDEPLVARILAAVVNAVPVPVTLKTRTGWSPETRNLRRIAKIAKESGIAMLAVHGRTRACGYSGLAEFDSLRALRAETDLPLVANGDIDSPERARWVLGYTGADAVMIGRAAQGRPWLFREISHYLATGERLPPPTPAWVCATLLGHLDALYDLYGTARGPRIARKHIGWYLRGQWPGDDPCRNEILARINRAETTQRQTELVRSLFDGLRPLEDAA
ncbi:MAG: tRNA dihydrouridine synthase DusB [Thiohalocapsa sp.]|uniref:tRNA dihydrouridine synthase DusB n=1 Tax=Thiohalocapsa sp. TaxID=2497641 RepID=UPI0025F64E5A|nr:tRNA dihydrouridine synthase DusB [Thiohalocapsa sp.]MCG6941542.1 tRNA dihydrouridine synthase DusB [Thiohalocapsa sp.]